MKKMVVYVQIDQCRERTERTEGAQSDSQAGSSPSTSFTPRPCFSLLASTDRKTRLCICKRREEARKGRPLRVKMGEECKSDRQSSKKRLYIVRDTP